MPSWKLSSPYIERLASSLGSFIISVAMLLVVSCGDDGAQGPDLPTMLKVSPGSPGKPGWHWSNPKPQGNDLVDVAFFDEHVGFAVGTFGAIVGSTDGGQTWTAQASGVSGLLSGLAVTGPMTAVAVGDDGVIVKTINRGATWKRQPSGGTAHLTDVDFADARHGIVVGQQVLYTTDGGATWSPRCGCFFTAVAMTDALTAFAIRGGEIHATTDGGTTWSVRSTNSPTLRDVFFSDATHGTAVGDQGLMLRTTDGGVSWNVQNSGTDAFLWSVAFSSATNGLAAGHTIFKGVALLRTTDGGEHWVPGDIGYTPGFSAPPLLGAAMLDGSTGIIVADAGNVLRTTDGGATWESTTHGAAKTLNGVSFGDRDDGIAVGDGEMMRSTDGGGTWTRQDVGRKYLVRVIHTGTSSAVVVGEDKELGGGVILRSTDGGTTWTTTHPGTAPLFGLDFADASTGVATGFFGTILRTTNGGATWVRQASPTNTILVDVAMVDGLAIAVGTNTTILRSTDGGINWSDPSLENVPLGAFLHGVDFADNQVGITVGSGGTILRTIDGGETWTIVESGVDAEVYDVAFRDRRTAVILAKLRSAEGSCVLLTTDGGAHWDVRDVIPADGLNALTISGKNMVTVVGSSGSILQVRDLFRPN